MTMSGKTRHDPTCPKGETPAADDTPGGAGDEWAGDAVKDGFEEGLFDART